MPRLTLTLLAALLMGAALTACGGSSASSKTTSSGPTATTTTGTNLVAPTGTIDANVANNPAVKQAVATCKATIDRQTILPPDLKAKLKNICDKAGTGDATAIRQASSQICSQIIKATLPASAQPAALAHCPKN